MALADAVARHALLRRGFALEYATLAWNVIGIVVLAIAAIAARSVALTGAQGDPGMDAVHGRAEQPILRRLLEPGSDQEGGQKAGRWQAPLPVRNIKKSNFLNGPAHRGGTGDRPEGRPRPQPCLWAVLGAFCRQDASMSLGRGQVLGGLGYLAGR
jgi:hypothetical protein